MAKAGDRELREYNDELVLRIARIEQMMPVCDNAMLPLVCSLQSWLSRKFGSRQDKWAAPAICHFIALEQMDLLFINAMILSCHVSSSLCLAHALYWCI